MKYVREVNHKTKCSLEYMNRGGRLSHSPSLCQSATVSDEGIGG